MNFPHFPLICQVSGRLLVLREMVLGGAGAEIGGAPQKVGHKI